MIIKSNFIDSTNKKKKKGVLGSGSNWILSSLNFSVQESGASGVISSRGISIYGIYVSKANHFSMYRIGIKTGSASNGASGTNGIYGRPGQSGFPGGQGNDNSQTSCGRGGLGGGGAGPSGFTSNGPAGQSCDQSGSYNNAPSFPFGGSGGGGGAGAVGGNGHSGGAGGMGGYGGVSPYQVAHGSGGLGLICIKFFIQNLNLS